MYTSVRWGARIVTALAGVGMLSTLGLSGTAMAASAIPDPVSSLIGCPQLGEGDVNGCVTTLQIELNAVHDAYNLTEDGDFGRDTRIAVLDFQGRHRVGADGLVGAETAALIQAEFDEISVGTPDLEPDATAPSTDESQDSMAPATGIITNCGDWTCSDYVSREGTRQMLDLLNSDDNPADLLSDMSCVLAGGKKSPICKVTDKAIEFGEAMTRRDLERAVDNNACFKTTYEKRTGVVTWVSTNNGEYCFDR